MAHKKANKATQPPKPIVPSYTPAQQPDSPEAPRLLAKLRKAILECSELSEKERIAAYNAASSALREMVRDICDDPVLSIKLVRAEDVVANDYNPNKVASPEMDLLEQSIRCDGVTMPLVTYRQSAATAQRTVVDGFHRRRVLVERLQRRYLPCSDIDKPIAERMASTVRHNRARGKHQVDLIAVLVKSLIEHGWNDVQIAKHLGMTVEELLRLKQMVGVARLLAAEEYSQSWGLVEGADGNGANLIE